jgi:hypothetical protein
MEAISLDREIAVYHTLLPAIKKEHGSVWALIVGDKLISTFNEFSQAARYVIAHHRDQQVLIRHTDERLETAPFVQINS